MEKLTWDDLSRLGFYANAATWEPKSALSMAKKMLERGASVSLSAVVESVKRELVAVPLSEEVSLETLRKIARRLFNNADDADRNAGFALAKEIELREGSERLRRRAA